MLDSHSFSSSVTLSLLTFTLLVVFPQFTGEYLEGYPNLSLQLGIYLTSLAFGTLFLDSFRDRITCIWLAVAMLISYGVYNYQLSHAQSANDLNIASLLGTIVWAVVLFYRNIINHCLFFVLGIFPHFRPVARRYFKAACPGTFQRTINYYIAVCLLFDVFFTLVWRILPLYFDKLVEGSLHMTFVHHDWPDLFDIYYDLNNLLVSTLILFIPLFIIIESINNKNTN